MDAPKSFWRLCLQYHQDVHPMVPANEEAVVEYLVGALRPAERQELAVFLDRVLRAPDANERLIGLWNHSQADVRMLPGSRVDLFFARIRSRL